MKHLLNYIHMLTQKVSDNIFFHVRYVHRIKTPSAKTYINCFMKLDKAFPSCPSKDGCDMNLFSLPGTFNTNLAATSDFLHISMRSDLLTTFAKIIG